MAVLIAVLLAGMAGSVVARKLTVPAALCGGVIGFCLYLGAGWLGPSQMALFFLLGTLATAQGRRVKERLGIAEKNKGQRRIGQVIANAGIPAVLALGASIEPELRPMVLLLVSACFSSAAADTLSSELGSVYGRRFFNILTGKPDRRGLDGVISFEGLVFGLFGSMAIALLHSVLADGRGWWIVVVAGTAGNLADSLLGATAERRGWIGNNWVNTLNTLIAALVAWLLSLL